jgi:hypothetical protein
MRVWCAALAMVLLVGLVPPAVYAQEYDGCNEQLYDSKDEACGGGHQHIGGKRDEVSLERSRHRHRYLEEQIRQLNEKVAGLAAEVEQLKKARTK